MGGFSWAILACGGLGAPEPRPARSPDRGESPRGKRSGRSAPAPSPGPAGPSPAFHTFATEDGKYRLVFTSAEVTKTWSNMSGAPVKGRWTQSGTSVEVAWTPSENHGSSAESFLSQSACVLVRTARVDATSGQRIESPTNYVLDEPQCRR